MAQSMSTKLCNDLLTVGSLKAIFNAAADTELRIYSGTVPTGANEAAGTKIATVLGPSAAYLSFASTASAGVLAKESGTWQDPSAVGGVASYYRLVQHADTDALDTTTYQRIQGTIGVGGSDMNVGTTTITASAAFTVNTFTQSIFPS